MCWIEGLRGKSQDYLVWFCRDEVYKCAVATHANHDTYYSCNFFSSILYPDCLLPLFLASFSFNREQEKRSILFLSFHLTSMQRLIFSFFLFLKVSDIFFGRRLACLDLGKMRSECVFSGNSLHFKKLDGDDDIDHVASWNNIQGWQQRSLPFYGSSTSQLVCGNRF